MVPIKSYLLRAAYEWALDGGCTPHLMVDATADGVVVPPEYVEDGRIVLNIHPDAATNLLIGNESVEFNARFSGRAFAVKIPVVAILGLYASENGEGIRFPQEDLPPPDGEPATGDSGTTPSDQPARRGKPDLKIIK